MYTFGLALCTLKVSVHQDFDLARGALKISLCTLKASVHRDTDLARSLRLLCRSIHSSIHSSTIALFTGALLSPFTPLQRPSELDDISFELEVCTLKMSY